MTAMISGRKFCLSCVLPFQHSRRMRHANEKHRVFAGFRSCVVKCAPWMLLEHIIDVLHAREIALPNTIHALVEPTNRWPESNAVVPNFSFTLQFREGLPECVVIHLLHSDVVQLKQIDPVCL